MPEIGARELKIRASEIVRAVRERRVRHIIYRLRGSDAVYAAVALRFGSPLVTLDREPRERVAALLPTRLPAEVLADIR